VAWVEGDLYEGHDALDTLADLKSREELIGEIVGLLLSPSQNVVGGLKSSGQNLAGILQTLSEEDDE
jgi:large subunit ribosomal protein L10